MPNADKLKRRAADYEAKRQYDRAIETYQELFALWEGEDPGLVEVSLYNRAGDLMQRAGNIPGAVEVWEKAVQLYEDGGFPNNAIALCNKILRSAPGRASVYHTLGRISAKKGFRGDAKRNFLEYADRMQKIGHVDEAFQALREFADLCPDEYEIRQMLADQLTRLGRNPEALEQLQHLFAHHDEAGDETAAATILERMRALDPSVEPVRRRRAGAASVAPDLVFLDLEDEPPPLQGGSPFPPPSVAASAAEVDLDSLALEPLDGPAAAAPASAEQRPETFSPDGFEPTSIETTMLDESIPLIIDAGPESSVADDLGASALAGLETTALDGLLYIDEATPLGREEGDGATAADVARDGLAPPGDGPPPDASEDDGLLDLDGLLVEAPSAAAAPRAPSAPDLPFLVLDGLDDLGAVGVEPDAPAQTGEDLLAVLQARVEAEPQAWALRQALGEALLEAGDRSAGLAALAAACDGFESVGDRQAAEAVLDELLRVAPEDRRWHERRVGLAAAGGEPQRLVDAQRALADALFRVGDEVGAAAAYRQVLALAPDDARARSALETLGLDAVPPAAAPSGGADGPAAPAPPAPPAAPADGYISLGDWLREDEGPKSTRMVVDAEEPSGDEDADFQDMLRKFKQGVAENVDEEDHESHYDLGVAFKEMGLVDEAIAEFQKALRGTERRVRTYEALGQCFVEKQQWQVATTILQRAAQEPGVSDDQLVGVLYLLGVAAESLGRSDDALGYFQRVFAVDITFRDVGVRLTRLEQGHR